MGHRMSPLLRLLGVKSICMAAAGRHARERRRFRSCFLRPSARWNRLLLPVCLLTLVLAGAAPVADNDDKNESLAGGAATVQANTRQAFGQPLPRLTADQETRFFVGNSFFNRNWVSAPASTAARDGLGPLFNARSCSACHLHDGRGRPPLPGEEMLSMLVRLSVPGHDPQRGVVPEPTYGDQFNGFAVPGVPGRAGRW